MCSFRWVIFPKREVRRLAAERSLPVASKHDSMDLCFVWDNDSRHFIAAVGGGCDARGPILDRRGRSYGEHGGLPGYTIRQRKGLGISGGAEPDVRG